MAKAKVKLNKENLVTVNGNVLEGQSWTPAQLAVLAANAVRNYVRRGLGKNENESEHAGIAASVIAAIRDGSIFVRKAREKFGLDRLINVLAELPASPGAEPMGKEVAEALVSKRQSSMNAEDFDKWTGAVRRQPEFKRVYAVKYPRKSTEPRQRRVTLEGLLN